MAAIAIDLLERVFASVVPRTGEAFQTSNKSTHRRFLRTNRPLFQQKGTARLQRLFGREGQRASGPGLSNRVAPALSAPSRCGGVRGGYSLVLLGLPGAPALPQLVALLVFQLAEPGVLLRGKGRFDLLVEPGLAGLQVLGGALAAASGGALLAQLLQLLLLGQ